MDRLPNIHPGEVLKKEFLEPMGITRHHRRYRLAPVACAGYDGGILAWFAGRLRHGGDSPRARGSVEQDSFTGGVIHRLFKPMGS